MMILMIVMNIAFDLVNSMMMMMIWTIMMTIDCLSSNYNDNLNSYDSNDDGVGHVEIAVIFVPISNVDQYNNNHHHHCYYRYYTHHHMMGNLGLVHSF